MADRPHISVVSPTFRRPQLLLRAIRSVQAQTYSDWELIISDDEDPPGESWNIARREAQADERIRAVRNCGSHGQCGNVNNGLRAARGMWIKPLYDDDLFCSNCLEAFSKAVEGQPSIALATCLAHRYRKGRLFQSDCAGARRGLELLPSRSARVAMYLQDVDVGIPTQIMVRRDIVEKGVLMEPLPGVSTAVDSWWYWRLLGYGDLLCLNSALVEEHQGDYASVTSCTTEQMHDREVDLLRQHMFHQLDPDMNPPSLSVVRQMVRVIRAMHRLSRRHPIQAAQLAAGAWHPKAWALATRWLARRVWPGRFYAVPRTALMRA